MFKASILKSNDVLYSKNEKYKINEALKPLLCDDRIRNASLTSKTIYTHNKVEVVIMKQG